MKRVRMTWVVGVWLASFGAVACEQGPGETCQINQDCSSGLVCCRSKHTGSISVRGLCYELQDSRCGSIPTDAGTNVGTTPADANMSLPDDGG